MRGKLSRCQAQAVVTHSAETPSEVPFETRESDYVVANDMPKLIYIPSISAEGFIRKVSIDIRTNEMAVPNNVHLAGWHVDSAKPGDDGLSIIDGHVSGIYNSGIFEKLAKMRPGINFKVEYGDGHSRTFQVVSNTSYSVDQVSTRLFAHVPSIKQRLNLITCGGK